MSVYSTIVDICTYVVHSTHKGGAFSDEEFSKSHLPRKKIILENYSEFTTICPPSHSCHCFTHQDNNRTKKHGFIHLSNDK